jgi:acyl-CoA thioesterase YciA
MTTSDLTPKGEMVLRTLAMPADTNANGDIFGGWLMSQMDIGGAIMAKEIAQGRVVTVRVDGMTFLRPVAVGDVVCCYARCVKRGSITINIEVWVKKCRLSRLANVTKPRKRCLSTWRSTIRVSRAPYPASNKAPGVPGHFTESEQREEDIAEDNHDNRQDVQWKVLHQNRMTRHHDTLRNLLAREPFRSFRLFKNQLIFHPFAQELRLALMRAPDACSAMPTNTRI